MHRLAPVLLLALICSLSWPQEGGLIRNPGFEEGEDRPAEWSLVMEGRGAGSATWVTDNPYAGKYCARVELAEPGDYWMAKQTYAAGTAKPDQMYVINGWYRSVGDFTHPCIYFRGADGGFLGAWERSLPAAAQWQPFEFVFKTAPRTDHLELQLRIQGDKGVSWYDDIAVQEAGQLVERGEALMGPALQIAREKPDHVWAIVSGAGRAELEFLGDVDLEVAWSEACLKDAQPQADYDIRVTRVLANGETVESSAGEPGRPAFWAHAFPRLGGDGQVVLTRLVAWSRAPGPRFALLVGLRDTSAVRRRLVRAQTTIPGLRQADIALPWRTRFLNESLVKLAQWQEDNRDDILRELLGAGEDTGARVCSEWLNLTSEQWVQWLVDNGRPTEPDPAAQGARNEYLSLQVLYAPVGRPETVTAHLSDLTGPNGTTIPSQHCQVRLLEYVPFGDRWLPDPLMEQQPFRPSGHGPIVLWVTVHVPQDARAGDYRGTVTMSADGGAPIARQVGIRVWDVTLPQETHLQSSFWLFRAQIRRHFDLPADVPMEDYYPYIDLTTSHRLSPVDVVEGPTEPMVKVYREQDGSLSYDFSYWDLYLDRLKAGGANTIHLGFTHWMAHYFSGDRPAVIDRQTGETVALGYEFGTVEHLDALGRYLRAAADHLKQRGEFDKCYIQPWDEPHGDGLAKSYTVLKGIMERVPDIPRLMDAVYPDAHGGEMAQVVNLWCPLSPMVGQGHYSKVRERGDTMWWYVCCGPRRPFANLFTNWKVPEMRALFWQTWQHKITGLLYWGLNYWTSWGAELQPAGERFPRGPWVASTSNLNGDYMGDGYFIYPGETVDKPLSSLRLETIRDGIEDYELLYLLNGLVERSSEADPETLKLAQEVLKVRPEVSHSLRDFDRTGEAMAAEREVIADLIQRLR